MPGAKLFDYADLFREAADALRVAGLYNEALKYYEPLREVEDYVDSSYFTNLAFCYREVGFRAEAEECYQKVMDHGSDGVDLRPQLIAMCREYGPSDRCTRILEQLSLAAAHRTDHPEDIGSARGVDAAACPSTCSSTMLASRSKPISKISAEEKSKRLQQQQQREHDRDSRLYGHFLRLERSAGNARLGNAHARAEWMAAAKHLIQDFRSNSIFYPTDKYMRFLGYSSEARARSAAMKPGQTSSETPFTSDELILLLGTYICIVLHRTLRAKMQPDSVPDQYRGIAFRTWLNIFLEYAFYLSQDANLAFSYDIICAARDANVFFHAWDSMLLIHVCWFGTLSTCCYVYNAHTIL